jgi:hypothetical protein
MEVQQEQLLSYHSQREHPPAPPTFLLNFILSMLFTNT